jgi:S-adenosylmethionine:tRNA ribosyltransferase-isomerase
MKLNEFEYDLPENLIAQDPPEERGQSRLLVLDKQTGQIQHKRYYDIPEFVKSGDVVVLNQTKVLKARVFPEVKRTERKVEVLFLHALNEDKRDIYGEKLNDGKWDIWYGLVGRARHVKIGDTLDIGGAEIRILDRESGARGFILATKDVFSLMQKYGHVPLPPYIKREDTKKDRERYNTVFAEDAKSVAAPTASLNLTENILSRIKKAGAQIAYVRLNVGWGTFAPVDTENIEDFDIHAEYIDVPRESVDIINNAEGRIWAFGTTVVRTLESVAVGDGKVKEYKGETDLYIYPPYEFKVADVLVTNFHAPQTSLVMLVSALGGKENVLSAYESAKKDKYKFLSYGDSMLII